MQNLGPPQDAAFLEALRIAKRLPKIELQLYLATSLSPEFVAKRAAARGVPCAKPDALVPFLYVMDGLAREGSPSDPRTVYDYLTQFLQTADEICDAVQEVCTRAVREGVIYCELRLCPPSHVNEGLTMWDVVEAALEGFSLAQDATNGVLGGGLILCVPRDAPESEANNVLLLAAQFAGCGVLGLEFGGCGSSGSRTPTALPATAWPLRRLAPVMVGTAAAGLQFTAWVGDDGPESLDDVGHALDLGAARICGGSALLHRNALVTRVASSGATFEANLTGAVHGTRRRLRSYMEHPALALIALRARVALSCGDLLLCGGGQRGCDPSSEIAHLVAHCGFGWGDAREVLLDGARACFLPAPLRDGLVARYEHLLDAALAAHGLRPRPAPAPAALAEAPARIPNPRLKSPRKSPQGTGAGRTALDYTAPGGAGEPQGPPRPQTPEAPGSPRALPQQQGQGQQQGPAKAPDPELPAPRTLTERKRAAAAAAAAAASAQQQPQQPQLTAAQQAAAVAAGQMQAAMDAVFAEAGAAGQAGGAAAPAAPANPLARAPASARFAAAKAAAAAALNSDVAPAPAERPPAEAASGAAHAGPAPPPAVQPPAAPQLSPAQQQLQQLVEQRQAQRHAAAASAGKAKGHAPLSYAAAAAAPPQPAWVAAAAAGGSAAPLAGEAPKWQRPALTAEEKRTQETRAAEARAAAASAAGPASASGPGVGQSNDIAAIALKKAFLRLGLQAPEPRRPTSPSASNRARPGGMMPAAELYVGYGRAEDDLVAVVGGGMSVLQQKQQKQQQHQQRQQQQQQQPPQQRQQDGPGSPGSPGRGARHSRHNQLPQQQQQRRPQSAAGFSAGAPRPAGAGAGMPPRPASAAAQGAPSAGGGGGRGGGAGGGGGGNPYDGLMPPPGWQPGSLTAPKREKPRLCGGWGSGGGGSSGGRVQTSEDAKDGGGGGGWFGWGRGRPRLC